MNTEELVDEALVGVRDFLASTPPIEPEDWEDSPKTLYVGGDNLIDHTKVARLRFDWELIPEAGVSVSDSNQIAHLITKALKPDLVDIIENGDIEIVNDPMLKSMNGANKLGKVPQKVIIEELVWYREHFPRKNAYEYTLFLLLRVDWN
jgi:hypothetical protein